MYQLCVDRHVDFIGPWLGGKTLSFITNGKRGAEKEEQKPLEAFFFSHIRTESRHALTMPSRCFSIFSFAQMFASIRPPCMGRRGRHSCFLSSIARLVESQHTSRCGVGRRLHHGPQQNDPMIVLAGISHMHASKSNSNTPRTCRVFGLASKDTILHTCINRRLGQMKFCHF